MCPLKEYSEGLVPYPLSLTLYRIPRHPAFYQVFRHPTRDTRKTRCVPTRDTTTWYEGKKDHEEKIQGDGFCLTLRENPLQGV